jgi:hypothetical protein
MHFCGRVFLARGVSFYRASVQEVWAVNLRLFSSCFGVYGLVSSPRHWVSDRKVRGWLVHDCDPRVAWALWFCLQCMKGILRGAIKLTRSCWNLRYSFFHHQSPEDLRDVAWAGFYLRHRSRVWRIDRLIILHESAGMFELIFPGEMLRRDLLFMWWHEKHAGVLLRELYRNSPLSPSSLVVRFCLFLRYTDRYWRYSYSIGSLIWERWHSVCVLDESPRLPHSSKLCRLEIRQAYFLWPVWHLMRNQSVWVPLPVSGI